MTHANQSESTISGQAEFKAPLSFDSNKSDIRFGMGVEKKYRTSFGNDVVSLGTDMTLPLIKNVSGLEDLNQIPDFSKNISADKIRFGINLNLFF